MEAWCIGDFWRWPVRLVGLVGLGASFGEYEGRPTVGGPQHHHQQHEGSWSAGSMARRVNSLQGSTQLRRSREGQTFSVFLITSNFSGSGNALKIMNMACLLPITTTQNGFGMVKNMRKINKNYAVTNHNGHPQGYYFEFNFISHDRFLSNFSPP